MSIPDWQGLHNYGHYQFSVYEVCNDSTYSYEATIFLGAKIIKEFTTLFSGEDCYLSCKKYIDEHKKSLTTIS